MVNELKLTGNDLICYALIYGFTQSGGYFSNSSSYISEWLGVSKRSVIEILKRLCDVGLLEKKTHEENGVKICEYKANVPNFTSGEESSLGGGEESSPHINKSNNKKKKEIDKSISTKDELFEQCWKEYRRKGSKASAKKQWSKIKEDDKSSMLKHIRAYVSSRELHYQKDFERYLKDEIFNSIVIANGNVIYDPSKMSKHDLFACVNCVDGESKTEATLIIDGQIYR